MARAGTRIRGAFGAAVVSLLIGGCGILGMPGSGEGQVRGGSGQTGGPPPAQQVPASPAAQDILEAPAIATGTLADNGEQLKVDLVSLQRTSDRMVRLDLRVTAESELTSVLTSYFGSVSAVDGISLVDGNAGKRYLVVHDSEGSCLCTSGRSSLSQGEVGLVYAYFPAPPASTKAVDVVIPNMVPFDDVTIAG